MEYILPSHVSLHNKVNIGENPEVKTMTTNQVLITRLIHTFKLAIIRIPNPNVPFICHRHSGGV